MSVYMIYNMHNQLYKEPDAGKPHVRILRGVSPVRGISTRHLNKEIDYKEVRYSDGFALYLIVGRRIEGDANCELFFQPLSH